MIYIPHGCTANTLHAAGISVVDEFVSGNKGSSYIYANKFSVVAESSGTVQKSDVGGVTLNIKENNTWLWV